MSGEMVERIERIDWDAFHEADRIADTFTKPRWFEGAISRLLRKIRLRTAIYNAMTRARP